MANLKNIPLPSNFSFGLFFSILFLVISFILFINQFMILSGIIALLFIIFLSITLCKSSLLTPLNKAWMLFGFAIGKIINPIILGFIFFILITPVSLFFKVIGRDELRLKKVSKKSFWVIRALKKIPAESFEDQF
tara:strand:+ start:12176 stop:12580 length:405 start_codon:yes stop_codon:yes gene_type:complete